MRPAAGWLGRGSHLQKVRRAVAARTISAPPRERFALRCFVLSTEAVNERRRPLGIISGSLFDCLNEPLVSDQRRAAMLVVAAVPDATESAAVEFGGLCNERPVLSLPESCPAAR
jgi:hypothetical protein